MRFGVLGPLTVWTDSGSVVRVPEAKVRTLLVCLLLQAGRPVTMDRLIDDLWGDRPPGNPANTLQTKVSALRRTLERAEPGARGLVVREPAGYLLRVPPDSVDLWRFRTAVARARTLADTRARAELLTEALALWQGSPLTEFADEQFAVPVIRQLEEEWLLAAEQRAEARLVLGEAAALVGELDELVARYPLRERLRALHIKALYRSGRQSEALSSYSELRERLADELGLEPGPELAALQQAVLRQEVAPELTVARPTNNLPAPLTDLVGRTTAVNELRTLLDRARLVTLTGPGGVGKTRLALETATRLTETADGVWLIELAGIDQPDCPESACGQPDEWLAEAVASAVGVRDDHPAALLDKVADAVRDQDVLLVLDNCEPFVEPVAGLVARLLRAAPRLRVLATSRQPLEIDGELLWPVPPLGIPAQAHVDPGAPAAEVLLSVRELSAVQLFVARAAAAVPGFELTADNVHAVGAICRRLDGLPLALELAATRLRALDVHDVLDRLDDRFTLLAGGRRDAPARQRTLRAMIDWSWDLLTEPERVVLRRLAVAAEGCDLEAAERICAGDEVTGSEVLDLLSGLVDRSLVNYEQRQGFRPRYRLLETVRAYGLERLRAAGEADRVRLRHAHYYAEFAERAEPWLRGSEQRDWLGRLDIETANARAALDTLLRYDATEPALRLVGGMLWYWFLRGRIGEARRSSRAVLALSGEGSPTLRASIAVWSAGMDVLAGVRVDPVAFDAAARISDSGVRARALWFAGYVLSTVGDLTSAERLTGSALELFRALEDRWGVAAALGDTASQTMATGDLVGAERIAEQSAALFQELGDRWGQLQASFALGALAQIGGEYDRAARQHRDALRMAEQLGLWPEVSYQLSWLGRVALLTDDFVRADELHERARRLAVEHGFTPGEMYARTGLALAARRQAHLDVAERHLLALLDWHRLVDFEPGNTLILAELGFVAEQRGDGAEALRRQREGFAIASRVGDPRAIALATEGLAGAYALDGEHVLAARLLGSASAGREQVGRPLPAGERGDVDRIAEGLRRALGDQAYTDAFDHGTRQSTEDVLASTDKVNR